MGWDRGSFFGFGSGGRVAGWVGEWLVSTETHSLIHCEISSFLLGLSDCSGCSPLFLHVGWP